MRQQVDGPHRHSPNRRVIFTYDGPHTRAPRRTAANAPARGYESTPRCVELPILIGRDCAMLRCGIRMVSETIS